MAQTRRPVSRRIDRTGQQYARLTVVSYSGTNPNGQSMWRCRCECGSAPFDVRGSCLSNGSTRSCGCLKRDIHRTLKLVHGDSARAKTDPAHEYNTWCAMIQRCENPKSAGFASYGGRGITICREWRESYTRFLIDMGPRPSTAHSIERKNNDLGYAKNNCVWATRVEQSNNQRKTLRVVWNGETIAVSLLARRIGMKPQELRDRLARGWTLEEAVTRPIVRRRRRT